MAYIYRRHMQISIKVEPGDKITLKEKYERKRYTFKVKGVYDYSRGNQCIYEP